jgi:hypothetical protein
MTRKVPWTWAKTTILQLPPPGLSFSGDVWRWLPSDQSSNFFTGGPIAFEGQRHFTTTPARDRPHYPEEVAP